MNKGVENGEIKACARLESRNARGRAQGKHRAKQDKPNYRCNSNRKYPVKFMSKLKKALIMFLDVHADEYVTHNSVVNLLLEIVKHDVALLRSLNHEPDYYNGKLGPPSPNYLTKEFNKVCEGLLTDGLARKKKTRKVVNFDGKEAAALLEAHKDRAGSLPLNYLLQDKVDWVVRLMCPAQDAE